MIICLVHVDVVAELDLAGFYRALRADGRGGASYDQTMMLERPASV